MAVDIMDDIPLRLLDLPADAEHAFKVDAEGMLGVRHDGLTQGAQRLACCVLSIM